MRPASPPGVFVCPLSASARASSSQRTVGGTGDGPKRQRGRQRDRRGRPARGSPERAHSTPLADFDVSDIGLFTSDTHWPWFERLRREDPVHYCPQSAFGPYWSVTRFHDSVAVDSDHETFSSTSELGGIIISDAFESNDSTSFISLDPPDHDAQRRVVTPTFSSAGMAAMEPLIRQRAAAILDELPVGETFDFVDKVSIELTSQMLATLFDYPFDQRRNLPKISDMALTGPTQAEHTPEVALAQQQAFMPLIMPFFGLWDARKDGPP